MKERKRIFIIDNEVDLCLLMKAYFLRKNYEVHIAHTFCDGLTLAKACQPSIILLTSAVCQNPKEDIKTIKEAVPGAEILVDGYHMSN